MSSNKHYFNLLCCGNQFFGLGDDVGTSVMMSRDYELLSGMLQMFIFPLANRRNRLDNFVHSKFVVWFETTQQLPVSVNHFFTTLYVFTRIVQHSRFHIHS